MATKLKPLNDRPIVKQADPARAGSVRKCGEMKRRNFLKIIGAALLATLVPKLSRASADEIPLCLHAKDIGCENYRVFLDGVDVSSRCVEYDLGVSQVTLYPINPDGSIAIPSDMNWGIPTINRIGPLTVTRARDGLSRQSTRKLKPIARAFEVFTNDGATFTEFGHYTVYAYA